MQRDQKLSACRARRKLTWVTVSSLVGFTTLVLWGQNGRHASATTAKHSETLYRLFGGDRPQRAATAQAALAVTQGRRVVQMLRSNKLERAVTGQGSTAPAQEKPASAEAMTTPSQQITPPGYLGPMQPTPFGPELPSPPGPLRPLLAPLLPNVRVNDKVNDPPDQTQSETTMAVDPTNADRLIGGFNDCRGFFFPSRNGISGWGFSVDGGNTWTSVQTGLPKANPADTGTRGDPSVDVDANGNFYYASLYQKAGTGTLNVSVHKGSFSGSSFTWGAPTFATNFTGGPGTDKEHIGVDKSNGNVYVSYTNFTASFNGQIEVVRSTDGGLTWSAPVLIAPGSGVVHQGSVPRVGPDGEIYVAWEDGFAQPVRSIHVRKSTAWPTFGPDVTVSSVTETGNPPNNSRINDFPTMDVDRSNGADRGRVYVAWNDGRFGGAARIGAILLSHSADGTTWSAPIQVNDDGLPSATGTHHWFPWLSVDRRGVANVGFYDRRLRIPDTQLTDVFAAQFTVAGGVKPNVRITNQSFSMAVPSRCTPNFGDYNGAATGIASFYFIWGDGRLENPDTFAGGITATPIFAAQSSVEACRSAGTTATITVLGGAGFFQNDVTLSLLSVNPPESTITANFNPNPVPAPPPQGSSSTMTVTTTGATPPGTYTLTVQGTDGNLTETTQVSLVVTSQPPGTPEQITPLDGEVDVSRRPTLTWTPPFEGGSPRPTAPDSAGSIDQTRNLLGIALPNRANQLNPLGTVRYHVQIASDRDFTTIVSEADTTSTSFTVPANLDLGAQYYWRVNASNVCGTSGYSSVRSFVVGACFGGFASVGAYPQPGILWNAATVFNGKIYSFGGSNTLASPIPAITNSYVYDPLADAWTAIAPLPGPRLLMNAAEVDGKIYVAGGATTSFFSDQTNTMFEYDVETNTWATKAPLPQGREGAAMASFGGKVYIFGGFVNGGPVTTNSVLEYDPVANTYTPKANMPTARGRSHAAVAGGKIYVIGGQGGSGRDNEAFDPVANTWEQKAPALWGLAFDMGTTALGTKIYVFGRDPGEGAPTATQVYDTATNAWTQFTPLQRAANNNQAVTVGSGFYIIGGFDGTPPGAIHNVVQRFKNCEGASGMISFVADGDGTVDVANERCDLIISNDLSGTVASALVVFSTPDGKADSSRAFPLAPGELASLTNIIRQVRGAEGVQNVEGSIAVLSTEPIDAVVSITNNATNDGTILDRQSLAGARNGFVPRIQLNDKFRTQVVITDASGLAATVQLIAYPPEGGDTPVATTSVIVPPHGLRDFPDIVSVLGLPSGYFGQLTWNSTQPVSVFARDVTSDNGFSGTAPAHSLTDGANALFIAYVEDTVGFSSNLQLNNNSPLTAIATVRFIDVDDPTGGTPGAASSRDIQVRVNSATARDNVIRWVLRSDSTEPLGKRGFLVITSPQIVTALASIVNNTTFDPAITDTDVTRGSSFTPIIVKLEVPAGSSRIAIANPGSTAANVDLMPFNADGTPALDAPVRVRVVGGGQFFTDDIVGFLGLPPIFLGSMTINANVPVLIFNQERTESNTGFVVPIHLR